MIYLVYGQQNVMIKNRLKKIVNERLDFVDEMNYVKYDMRNTTIQDVIEDANMMPLGYEHKLIVAEDCDFLKKMPKKEKAGMENDLNAFAKYLNNPNENCDLVLTLNEDSIDDKSDIYKKIAKDGKVFQLLSVEKKDWNTYIYRYFTNSLQIKIDRDAIDELSARVKGDLNVFVNEANKLSLYTDHVTYQDVCKLVNRPLEDNAFEIFNLLMKKENGAAIKLFKDLRVDGVEPVRLISMLANQFRLLWQIAYLSKTGLDNAGIASELKIKEVRVKILKRYMYSMTLEDLHNVLNDLYMLDYNIKSGQIDRFYSFELFLINFNFA